MANEPDPLEELRRLEAEVEALRKRREQLLAQLSGSGAIAQQGGVAAGAGGVAIGGDVHGNVYVGPPPKDTAEALSIYRRVVAQTTGQLPLRGVDVGAADPTTGQKPLGLANVYVDLDTTTQVELTKAEKKKHERVAIGERETTLVAISNHDIPSSSCPFDCQNSALPNGGAQSRYLAASIIHRKRTYATGSLIGSKHASFSRPLVEFRRAASSL